MTVKTVTTEPKVKIYTTGWCAFCQAEKKFLDHHHIAYVAVDVETDTKAAAELTNLSHQLGVPFTVITKPDGSITTVLGFNRPLLVAELGLAG